MSQIYQQNLKLINGQSQDLGAFEGKVLLIVNVASKCGLTPQYEGLEKIYKAYKEKGLEILGFPANEFLAQEPGSNNEIAEFCQLNYGVSFPLFEKIVVKGENQHPLYKYLTNTKPQTTMKPNGTLLGRLAEKGLLAGKDNDIKWNFEKFLISRSGEILERFSPELSPDDQIITSAIEKALN